MLPYLSLTIATLLSTAYSFVGYVAPQPLSFELNGKLYGRDTGLLVLWYPDTTGNYRRDTTYLQNGGFYFKGFINEPSYVHIIGEPRVNNYSSFFLEPGRQWIELEQSNSSVLQMSGSASQAQASLLKLRMDSAKAKSTTQQDSLLQSIKIDFIAAHPSSYVSATELLGLVNSIKAVEAEKLYYSLDVAIRNSRTGILCYNEIQKKKKIHPGVPAPHFETTDYKKKALALSQFKGKYVLLDFWASWCIPCRESVPALRKVYSEYHKKGLEIIAISDDDTKQKAWKKAIKKDKTKKWNHLLNGVLKQNDGSLNLAKSINEKFSIHILPTKILIDKDNTILGVFTGAVEEEKMYTLLKEIFE